jgi:hypothetical protein
MVPQRLEELLPAAVNKYNTEDVRIVLVYGDCSSRMLDIVKQYRIGRVDAINCTQMLLGKERYRELMKAESFMLLPEWAMKWRHIMKTELGLSREVARDLMGENRRELVYLDTGLVEIPVKELEECSEYTGLPWRIEKVTLDNLLNLMLKARDNAVFIKQENQ